MAKPVATKKLVGKLFLVVVAMFGFGYALVPIYNVLCDITGLNGRLDLDAMRNGRVQKTLSNDNRQITVEFLATTNQGLNWEFKPHLNKMDIQPGQTYTTTFFVKNNTNQRMVGQAVPSVAPYEAVPHFVKIECFCFTNQPLEPGESKDMPVIFTVDANLSPRVETISLSYTFFDITNSAAAKSASKSTKS